MEPKVTEWDLAKLILLLWPNHPSQWTAARVERTDRKFGTTNPKEFNITIGIYRPKKKNCQKILFGQNCDCSLTIFACDRGGNVDLLLWTTNLISPHGGAILVVENTIFILWPLKWRHQVVQFNFCFIEASLNFLGVVCYRSLEPKNDHIFKFCF